MCPVVLVNEYLTSKMCHGCGQQLQRTQESRLFRCVSTSQTSATHCSVGTVDRDTNGAANIATCGVRQMLSLCRPKFLQRTPSPAVAPP
jgi:transposase